MTRTVTTKELVKQLLLVILGMTVMLSPVVAMAQDPPQVACNPDTGDARAELSEVLTRAAPGYIEWRTEVGLSGVDPSGLVLITDDSLCATLWAAVSSRLPNDWSVATFFQVDNHYIVTEYSDPNPDPSGGVPPPGTSFTSIVDDQLQVVNPTLMH